MAFSVLVAEDEEITLKHLKNSLAREGFEVAAVTDGADAFHRFQEGRFDAVIADIKMPGMSGLELLARVKGARPETEVIIITGYGSISSAVEAMKKGAFDYVTKPFELDELIIKVKKIKEKILLKKENTALKAFIGGDRKLPVIARSEGMRRIIKTVDDIKDSGCGVLLTGESGTGKTLLAKLIHSTSGRRKMPFLSLNCATFTEELLASELFGHEKGAFTGAVKSKQGLAEIADGGTLFLDEISEMSPNLQAKLLKVLEEGEFYRVGGTKPLKVDVRFIAATNRNVKGLISEGRFREDLYYRLNVMEFFIPPLRERREDIGPLCRFFLEKHAKKAGKDIQGLSKETMEILKGYSYPGNVRELENIIERAVILENGSQLTPGSLPGSLAMFKIETLERGRIKTLDELGREYAEKVIESLGGNRTKAAELLGISRTSLWRILKEE